MDILAPLIPALTGTLPPICLGIYLLFKTNYQEKETQRLRRTISELRDTNRESIKELSKTIVGESNGLDKRIKKIELKIAKIWSDS